MMINRTLKWISDHVNGTLKAAFENVQISGVSIDSRNIYEGVLFIPFKGEHVDGHRYVEDAIQKGAHAALWQRDAGEAPEHLPIIIVDDTLTALQTFSKAYLMEVAPKVIAVTGSNGKTTTKDMIEAVLAPHFKVKKTEGNYNNEIGLPLTLCQLDEDTEISILEMGMSGFGEISFLSTLAEPHIAAITNIGESHMRDLGSREGIAKAKYEIVDGLNGPLFYDGDEPLLQPFVQSNKDAHRIGFSEDNEYYIHDLKTIENEIEFTVNNNIYKVPTIGSHNARNATIAIAIAKHLGISDAQINENFARLKLTGMRMEQLKGMNGATLINDAYNASPTSMKAAIDTIDQMHCQTKVIVFSDVLELGEDEKMYHEAVGRYIEGKAIDYVFTTGEAAKYIHEAAKPFVNTMHFDSKKAVTKHLKPMLNDKTTVLFKASRGMKLETIINELL